MPAPSLREIRQSPATYPLYQVCPKCRGDRGHITFTPTVDDGSGAVTGTDFAIVACDYCLGERVTLRPV